MKMQEIKEGTDEIIEAINLLIERKVRSLEYDRTYKAIVIENIDNKGKQFRVEVNGVFHIVPLISWRLPKQGDVVLFIVPRGNLNQAFIQ